MKQIANPGYPFDRLDERPNLTGRGASPARPAWRANPIASMPSLDVRPIVRVCGQTNPAAPHQPAGRAASVGPDDEPRVAAACARADREWTRVPRRRIGSRDPYRPPGAEPFW